MNGIIIMMKLILNNWMWIVEFFILKLNLENGILKNWTLIIKICKINEWNNNNNENNI